MKQNKWKFIKYVIHHRHPMTPEQLKQKPFEELFKTQHEKLDTDEGESNEEEHKSTTSSDKSEPDSESDKTTEDEQETNTTETHQVHYVLNETTHDEENVSEAEDDTSQEENVIEIQIYENNRGQNKQEDKLLTTNFEVKVKNRKVEGLIKRYSNLRSILELTKKYGEFMLIFNQSTVNGRLMPFYNIWVFISTENPNVMMRENHNTQSSEYIIIYQDGLYILSNTPEEILLMIKDKYKIEIYLQDNYPHAPGGKENIKSNNILNIYMKI